MPPLQNGEPSTGPVSRREALARMARGSVVLAVILAVIVFLRLPIPSTLKERTLVRVGSPEQFPFNVFTFVPERNIFIYRTREGFRALSALCPHLGCVVTAHGSGFRCPCHGSMFDDQGTVLDGPSLQPLSWLKVGMAPDGQITVDMSERVSSNHLLKV
jgi:Rieske Fe-S protein